MKNRAAVATKTGIEWTGATWNPVTGCSKVSPGCAHCYAERLSLRFGSSQKTWLPANAAENVVMHPKRLDQPLRWRRPRLIFVNSMSDLFHERVPLSRRAATGWEAPLAATEQDPPNVASGVSLALRQTVAFPANCDEAPVFPCRSAGSDILRARAFRGAPASGGA